jgi:methionyl aminopeptidase
VITLRSHEELESIRRAGSVVRLVLEAVRGMARPGVATIELNARAEDIIRKHRARPAFKGYKGFPASICTSINEVVVHGIPSKRCLKEGDIVSIDVGVELNGYFADAAETFGVGAISNEASRLISVAQKALERGISVARPGNRLSDISSGIQECVEQAGFSVVRAFVGHGIGSEMHEEPEIPNFGKPHRGVRLEPGMVLAIEPMINAGGYEVQVLEDGWTAVTKDKSLSAHFEDTVAVSVDDPEILTQ